MSAECSSTSLFAIKMTHDCISNNYEEARQKRLQDNKKRFEDLGILKISKGLSDLTNSEKKSQQRLARPKSTSVYALEPRRSSRARNPVPSYCDEVDIGLRPLRKRSKFNSSSWASYLARPLNEVRTASYEERVRAMKGAEELQSNLQSQNPSFIKSMVRSHVYSCFWLGLPSKFCNDYLPKTMLDMVLEDENATEYEATYIGKRTGLSGGWRAFALDHKLDDGDALVFELIEPTRFKIYTVKASQISNEGDDVNVIDKEVKRAINLGQNNDPKSKETKKFKAAPQKSRLECGTNSETKSTDVKDTNDNIFVSLKKLTKIGRSTRASKSEEKEIVENEDECVLHKSRKRAAPTRLLRKRV